MKNQSGFTLVELVVVVVLLGFLAATAIPKYIDITEQAKQANIEGMAGGFATGISLVRSQWEAEGRPQTAGNVNNVNYDGVNLVLTSPTASDTSIRPGYAVGLTDGHLLDGDFDVENCIEVWENILQQPPGVTDDIDELNNNNVNSYFVSVSGATPELKQCHYYLKESLERDASTGAWDDPQGSTTIGNSFTYTPANSSVIVYITNSSS